MSRVPHLSHRHLDSPDLHTCLVGVVQPLILKAPGRRLFIPCSWACGGLATWARPVRPLAQEFAGGCGAKNVDGAACWDTFVSQDTCCGSRCLGCWPLFVPTHLLSLIPPVSESLIYFQWSIPLLRRDPESVSVARPESWLKFSLKTGWV